MDFPEVVGQLHVLSQQLSVLQEYIQLKFGSDFKEFQDFKQTHPTLGMKLVPDDVIIEESFSNNDEYDPLILNQNQIPNPNHPTGEEGEDFEFELIPNTTVKIKNEPNWDNGDQQHCDTGGGEDVTLKEDEEIVDEIQGVSGELNGMIDSHSNYSFQSQAHLRQRKTRIKGPCKPKRPKTNSSDVFLSEDEQNKHAEFGIVYKIEDRGLRLILDGYKFRVNKREKSGRTYWLCTTKGCPTRLAQEVGGKVTLNALHYSADIWMEWAKFFEKLI